MVNKHNRDILIDLHRYSLHILMRLATMEGRKDSIEDYACYYCSQWARCPIAFEFDDTDDIPLCKATRERVMTMAEKNKMTRKQQLKGVK